MNGSNPNTPEYVRSRLRWNTSAPNSAASSTPCAIYTPHHLKGRTQPHDIAASRARPAGGLAGTVFALVSRLLALEGRDLWGGLADST